MSRVLKKLTFLTESGNFRSFYLSRNDVRIFRSPVNTGSLARSISHFLLLRCKNVEVGLYSQSVIGRRSMSILTDLLKRKKDKDDLTGEDDEAIPEVKTLTLIDDPLPSLTEEEIEARRDMSRLSPHHKRLVNGQNPYPEPKAWFHHTVRYKQKMFGKYGESSGVNPGILWPTREDLALIREYEEVCYPFTIQEMVEKKKKLRQQEKEAYERRAKEVEEKMAMVDKYKEDLERRMKAKEDEANEAKARRERLVEEVRRHFGYTVDPREQKFQELLDKKEKEQRKQMKEARKLEKQKKMLDKLEGKSGKEKSKKSAKDSEPSQKDKYDDDD